MDTATPVTTVALVRVGGGGVERGLESLETVAERSHRDPRRHGEVLPGQISDVLAEAGVRAADLDAVAVGVGPGAFTGLRVGLATAQALGLALRIPVHGVVTLDAIAHDTHRSQPFFVVTDAKRGEVFWSRYADARTPTSPPAVVSLAQAGETLVGHDVVAPPGTPELPGVSMLRAADPSAVAICAVALRSARNGRPQREPLPLYLRRPDVSPSTRPKSVLS